MQLEHLKSWPHKVDGAHLGRRGLGAIAGQGDGQIHDLGLHLGGLGLETRVLLVQVSDAALQATNQLAVRPLHLLPHNTLHQLVQVLP